MARYIIPFMFISGPQMLLIGDPLNIAWATITACLGILFLSAAVQRCMYQKTNLLEMLFFFAGAILLIKPGIYTDLLGMILGGSAFLSQRLRLKRTTSASETSEAGLS